jgi:hypothetical protein
MKLRPFVWPVLLVAAVSCSRKGPAEPPFATPSVALNHEKAPLGSPIEVSYRFVVKPDAPRLSRNCRVFVHFLDADRELMWTDDHAPKPPTSEWKPGQTVQYTRTVFIPVYPYVGEASIEVGLYSNEGRVTLEGKDSGQRSYEVKKLQLLPQTENVFLIYKDGWNPAEVAADNPGVEWQWTKKEATIGFRNPKRDVLLYLQLDSQPPALGGPQMVDVRVGDQTIDSFSPAALEEPRKIPVTAAQLGTGEMAEIRLVVDRTFIPALIPAMNNKDQRELGVRVFHAFVEPR